MPRPGFQQFLRGLGTISPVRVLLLLGLGEDGLELSLAGGLPGF
jgi:hypothetical protein